MLGSVFEEPLSESEYRQIRTVMLSMAQLLANLEDMLSSKSASDKLRAQVARIDEYMASQRRQYYHEEEVSTTQPSGTGYELLSGTGTGELTEPTPLDLSMSMSPFQLPPDLLDDWSWTFDFAQGHVGGM